MSAQDLGDWWRQLPDLAAGLRLQDLLWWLLIAIVVVILVRVARAWIDKHVDDVNQRHRARKLAGYLGAAVVVLVGLALILGRAVHVAAVLGILAAGAAIALQDTLRNLMGWIYVSGPSGVRPGARVEVEGTEGEVIDVGPLKTKVLEVGNLVFGRQSSGRITSIPNSAFLNRSVIVSPDYSPFVWSELRFLMTYESDWKRGVEVLEELGREESEGLEAEVEAGFRELERRYAFKHGPLTPIVYVRVEDSGVELTLRYLTHLRARRGSEDRVMRGMLEAVEREPGLDFAYPTRRVYRRGERPEASPRMESSRGEVPPLD